METTEKFKATLVTGVIGEDIHITGIKILEHALRDAGFKVVSLGIQVSQEEFVKAAIETNADAILVSSLGGHAKINVEGLRDKCIEAGLKDVRLYIGGILAIDEPWEDTKKTFEDLGFDRVYRPYTMPGPVIADLEADFFKKGG